MDCALGFGMTGLNHQRCGNGKAGRQAGDLHLDVAVETIESICGDLKLPASAVAQIAERTDGLPLFIEDLTRDVLEGSSAAIPLRAAAETTWANVPRSRSYPRSTSLWRRCRIAAFCSAIDNSWNHIPCAAIARATRAGGACGSRRSPASTPSISG